MNQKSFLALAILGIILVAGCVQTNSPDDGVMCTEDAKICPDGSAVGRVPPNCDFEPCPQSELSESVTVVKSAGGQAKLDARCADETYINEISDYVIKGAVTKVESGWNADKTQIFTYSDIDIDEYSKGEPFDSGKMQIVTPGGCADDICSSAEDQPAFNAGDYVEVRFSKSGDEYAVVCGANGVSRME